MSLDFERIGFDLEHGDPSGFEALWRQAEQQLRNECASGFNIFEIGQLAWSRLPIEGYAKTLRSLFFCYWIVDRQEQEEDRVRRAALDAGEWPPAESALTKARDALACGPDGDGNAPIEYEALRELADEVVVLRERMAILRKALGGDPS